MILRMYKGLKAQLETTIKGPTTPSLNSGIC
jgi:hypothetical protein